MKLAQIQEQIKQLNADLFTQYDRITTYKNQVEDIRNSGLKDADKIINSTFAAKVSITGELDQLVKVAERMKNWRENNFVTSKLQFEKKKMKPTQIPFVKEYDFQSYAPDKKKTKGKTEKAKGSPQKRGKVPPRPLTSQLAVRS